MVFVWCRRETENSNSLSSSLIPSAFIIFYLSSTPDEDYVSKALVFLVVLYVSSYRWVLYNNYGYLERLTLKGPKCLSVNAHVFSRFNANNTHTILRMITVLQSWNYQVIVFSAGFLVWQNDDVEQTSVTSTHCVRVTTCNCFRLSWSLSVPKPAAKWNCFRLSLSHSVSEACRNSSVYRPNTRFRVVGRKIKLHFACIYKYTLIRYDVMWTLAVRWDGTESVSVTSQNCGNVGTRICVFQISILNKADHTSTE